MINEELLSEEKYRKVKGKLSHTALIVLIIGLLVGGSMLCYGIFGGPSDEKLSELKTQLEEKRDELENSGVTECSNYRCGDGYDLYVINEALDPSFDHCAFDEYKNSSITGEYCKARNASSLDGGRIVYCIIGGFLIFAFGMFAGQIYFMSRGREVLSFMTQQTLPVAAEGFEKVAPTVARVKKGMMKDMAPAYGELAKEISKGIKEGINEANEEE